MWWCTWRRRAATAAAASAATRAASQRSASAAAAAAAALPAACDARAWRSSAAAAAALFASARSLERHALSADSCHLRRQGRTQGAMQRDARQQAGRKMDRNGLSVAREMRARTRCPNFRLVSQELVLFSLHVLCHMLTITDCWSLSRCPRWC